MSKWEKANLSDVLFFQEGPGVRNTQYTQSGVKLLNVANLQDGKIDLSTSGRYISEKEAYGRYKHFLVDEGDLIIASSGIKVEYFDKKMGIVRSDHLPLCMNTSTIRFKVLNPNRLNLQYFMYYLKSNNFKRELSKQITGSAQLNFGPSHLKKFSLPLPPIVNQENVVKRLETIIHLLETYRQQHTELDNLIKSTFYKMFGDPICNEKNWEVRKYRDILIEKPQNGFFAKNEEYSENGNTEVIWISDFIDKIAVELSNLRKVNASEKDIQKYRVTYGDMLFVRSSLTKEGIGKCSFVPETVGDNVMFECHIIRTKIDLSIMNPIFLQVLTTTNFFRHQIIANAKTSTMTTIGQEGIIENVLIVPPLELQNQFAEIVTKIEEQKALVKQAIDETQLLFDSLMSQYFDE